MSNLEALGLEEYDIAELAEFLEDEMHEWTDDDTFIPIAERLLAFLKRLERSRVIAMNKVLRDTTWMAIETNSGIRDRYELSGGDTIIVLPKEE